ncbi:MAG TPA: hypothetical protein VJ485_03865 [archaeon]|nr:hypothetical protein [archaeon]
MGKLEVKCSEEQFKHCINHWQENIYRNCPTWKDTGYCRLEPKEDSFFKKVYKWAQVSSKDG